MAWLPWIFIKEISQKRPQLDFIFIFLAIIPVVVMPFQGELEVFHVSLMLVGLLLSWWIIKVHVFGYRLLTRSRLSLGISARISDSQLGRSVWVLDYSEFFQEGTLLTLMSASAGFHKPLCVLQVWKVISGQKIQAVQLVPPEADLNLESYVNDESKRAGLYAIPDINYEELRTWSAMSFTDLDNKEGESI